MRRRPAWLGPEAALGALSAVLFLTFLDNTVVSVVLADLQGSLGLGVSGLQWVVDGYMLAFAALMLMGGTLGDLYGRKRVMLWGVGLFCLASLGGAIAESQAELVAARVAMGIGAAASEPGTLSMIRHLYRDRQERALALGVWSAVSGVALALGPILGGLLVALGGWRAVFWFNLGFGLLAFAWAALALDESADPEGRQLDLRGLVVGTMALLAATAAVIQGEGAGYDSWWVALLFAFALVCAVGFVLVERRAPDPLLRLELLHLPGFDVANLAAFVANFALFSVFFFSVLYLQLIAGFSGLDIALQFVAMAVTMALAGVLAGHLTARFGPRLLLSTGLVLGGGGLLVVDWLLSPTVSVATLTGPLALAGFGLGMVMVTMTAGILNIVEPSRSGLAASTINTSRELGGVFGVAVLGAVVNAQLTGQLGAKLKELGIPANFRELVVSAITHGTKVPKTPAAAGAQAPKGQAALVAKVEAAAQQAAGHGIHLALLIAALLAIASGLVTFALLRDPQARQGFEDEPTTP